MSKSEPRNAVVKSVANITPNMRQITFAGPDLADYPEGKEGGYIKLVFPDLPRVNPKRPVMRTFSIRAYDATKGELKVDFALHDDTGGIAMDWAWNAKPGDIIPIGGPGKVKMAPEDADWYLIAADMTGLPAALCNLEMLPRDAKGYAILEITSEQDIQDVAAPTGVDLRWVINPAPHAQKDILFNAISGLEWMSGDPFVWTACEFDTMRLLRSFYHDEKAVDRKSIYLSSYWRAGRTEDQHKVNKSQDTKATES